jgi:hypothetical protein
MNMSAVQKKLASRRQSRIRASVLALLFSALNFFPSLHILAEHHHDGASCLGCAIEVPANAAAVVEEVAATSEACFGCQIISNLQLFDFLDGSCRASLVFCSPFTGQVPDAPVLVSIYRANRAQAPPVVA